MRRRLLLLLLLALLLLALAAPAAAIGADRQHGIKHNPPGVSGTALSGGISSPDRPLAPFAEELRRGEALLAQHKHLLAVRAFRTALEYRPGDFDATVGLGVALVACGAFAEAREQLLGALALQPTSQIANVNAARAMLRMRGSDDELRVIHARLGAALADADGGLGVEGVVTWSHLEARFGNATVARLKLEAVAADPKVQALPPRDAARVFFRLARLRRDAGDHDGAFALAAAANRRSSAAEHEAGLESFVACVHRYWRAPSECIRPLDDRLRVRPLLPPPEPAAAAAAVVPVFIVGLPRTGSTLLEMMLGRSPHVRCLGEDSYLSKLMFAARGPDDEFSEAALLALRTRYREYLAALAGPGVTHVTDKLPGNYLWLDVIARLFPEARVLHTRRSPLDAALSMFMTNFAPGQAAFGQNLTHIGLTAQAHGDLMAAWEADGVPFAEVQYEELVLQPERVMRAATRYIGLPFEEGMLRPEEGDAAVTSASWESVRQPLYASAIGQWRHYFRHLQPLVEAMSPRFT